MKHDIFTLILALLIPISFQWYQDEGSRKEKITKFFRYCLNHNSVAKFAVKLFRSLKIDFAVPPHTPH